MPLSFHLLAKLNPSQMHFGFLSFVKCVVGFFTVWAVVYWIADRAFKAKVKKLGAHPVMGKYFLPYGLDLVYKGMQVPPHSLQRNSC